MRFRVKRMVKGLVMIVLAVIVFGYVTERLWNWLVPAIFGLRAITFWQAVGLLVLSKILLGGVHRHGGGRPHWNKRREWKRRMKARWAEMTPEERERFRAGIKAKWGCRGEELRREFAGFKRDFEGFRNDEEKP